MIAVFISFLVTVLTGLFASHARFVESREERTRSTTTLGVALLATVVGATFVLQIATIAAAARHQQPFPAWFALLPIVVLDDRAPLYGHAPIGISIAAFTLVETLALVALVYVGRRGSLSRGAAIVVGVVSFVMVSAAFTCPAATSFDMYAYDGTAHVAAPYQPASIAFTRALSVINRIYGVPISPSPYGPAWIALSKVATSALPTFHAQLLALRALGVLAFAATLVALRLLGFPAISLAVVALNPALVSNYVLDGHNDLVAVALVLWAMVLVERSAIAAIAFGVLAGAVKLPFLAIAALAFTTIASRRVRVACIAALVVAGIAVYAAFGGRGFVLAVQTTSRLYGEALADPLTNIIHGALVITAVGFIAAAVFNDRYVPTAAWSFGALAATFFGWYVPWGTPYAVVERRWFLPFMISLPGLSYVLSTTYAVTLVQTSVLIAFIVLAPIAPYVSSRKRAWIRA
ncbi:MAG: hypothetical protein IAI50_21305 [Candidatus Eremiobacteraeota bacterium]|nr:hypothetical protein [Candidatus Eremiobacteraeota bacterium]